MKLASLFSGGKDSTYAIYKALQENHSIECLVSICPQSEESHLLHYDNINVTSLQAKAMKIPQILTRVANSGTETELEQLHDQLDKAKADFGIEGIVHGGLFSNYQRNHFEKVANNLNLKVFSPLWLIEQQTYLQNLINSKFKFIITSVTSAGLDETWLGREITIPDVEKLKKLSSKHGFNLAFEGGEAETCVVDCPLFSSPIQIIKANKIWDGYRGRFEITESLLHK